MSVIDLTEEFSNPLGQWENYDNYQAADRTKIRDQKHVDIRSFVFEPLVPLNMIELSTMTVGEINGRGMNNVGLKGGGPGGIEHWTKQPGNVTPTPGGVGQTDTRQCLAINANTSAGNFYTVASAMPERPIDILSAFEDDDIINMAITGNWDSSKVDLANTTLAFTDGPKGDFTDGNTASVPFTASLVSVAGTGNKEFRILRSALTGIDLSHITGVRLQFKVVVPGSHIFQILALRILAKTWTHTALDFDTIAGRVRRNPTPNGDSTITGSTWPIMWRASEPSGQDDPRPIDAEMGVVFYTGYLLDPANINAFTLYFREVTEDFLTQLDINGLKMSELDGHDQPDLGEAMYNSRVQTDLEYFTQDQLANQQQFSLERTPDYFSASWIQFSCQWQNGAGQVSILDTEGNGYTFTIPSGLAAESLHVFYATLEENSARATIYTIDSTGQVGTKVFDSTIAVDDNAYKRRKGRFGWHADLVSSDAYIDSIRTRSVSYGEYRSLPYTSVTPVAGAELFVNTSPPIELFETLTDGPWNSSGSSVTTDTQRTVSGSSYKFVTNGDVSMQGVQTNSFLLSDFDNSVIKFDLYYPSSNTGDIKALLADPDGYRYIELLLPPILRDQWQTIKIDLPFDQEEITGRYKLIAFQPDTAAGTMWIDNISIYSRTVAWDGRAVADDPWGANDARWTPFKDNMNSDNGGVLFSRRGSQLQVRARALRPDAHIDRVQFKPHYAELGKIKTAYSFTPVTASPSFSTSNTGLAVTFTASNTFNNSGAYVALYEWSFGDGGMGVGQVVDHTYAASGVYTVTLVITDNQGTQTRYVNTVSV